MKAACYAKLVLLLGLALALMGFESTAIAQDERSLAISKVNSRLSRQFNEPLATGPLEQDNVVPNGSLPLSSLRVMGSALKPLFSNVGWDWVDAKGGSIYATIANEKEPWSTPVFLPQGSVVSSLRMYYYDKSANDCFGFFTVYDNYGNIVNIWHVQSSGTPENNYGDSEPINHTIDYENYYYALEWIPNQLNSTMMLHGFRIFYHPSGTRYGSSLILSSPPPP